MRKSPFETLQVSTSKWTWVAFSAHCLQWLQVRKWRLSNWKRRRKKAQVGQCQSSPVGPKSGRSLLLTFWTENSNFQSTAFSNVNGHLFERVYRFPFFSALHLDGKAAPTTELANPSLSKGLQMVFICKQNLPHVPGKGRHRAIS